MYNLDAVLATRLCNDTKLLVLQYFELRNKDVQKMSKMFENFKGKYHENQCTSTKYFKYIKSNSLCYLTFSISFVIIGSHIHCFFKR